MTRSETRREFSISISCTYIYIHIITQKRRFVNKLKFFKKMLDIYRKVCYSMFVSRNDYYLTPIKEGKTVSRYSPQKELIISILEGTTAHPSAASVYEKAREKMPNISLGTVYRNLMNLSKEGTIQNFSFGDISHFDGNAAPHPHFCCTSCGQVSDLKCDFSKIVGLTEGLDGCSITGETLLFSGLCRDCLAKN